jgi:hypothetical protein
LKNLEEKLKSEIESIWLTSDEKKFIEKEEALVHEYEIQKENKDKDKKVMEIYDIIVKILSSNDWGLYFKGDPIVSLPVNQGEKVFKVNDVTLEELHNSLNANMNQGSEWTQRESSEQTSKPKSDSSELS